MISFFKKEAKRPPVIFFNTLGRTKEEFKPLSGKVVKMYTCGPTVYDYAHIGNFRAYVFADTVRRVLEYNGYKVKQVMNITDFGHLTSDEDEGEDKMTLALKREGKELTLSNMKALGEKYAEAFFEDMKRLNIEMPFLFPRASDHIKEQVAYIETLLDKGYAYETKNGVYFDVAKFRRYGALGGSASSEHSRIGVNPEKHDARDFSLWKKDKEAGWESPWGRGFPGWHIECTAMATKYLGKSFDIHTGGVDHISVHHNNEIAQAEAATGRPYVRYWLHGEFITIEGKRIGKSEGNAIRLYQLQERGFSPLAYRYLLLGSHYRQVMNFTWEALEAAQTALHRALRMFADFPNKNKHGSIVPAYRERFRSAVNDDLNTPEALAILWELLKDASVSPEDKRSTVLDFDAVLGIGFGGSTHRGEIEKLSVLKNKDLPDDVAALLREREELRKNKDFKSADILREEILTKGFSIEDGADGPLVRRAP